jgi:hypothetical protein
MNPGSAYQKASKAKLINQLSQMNRAQRRAWYRKNKPLLKKYLQEESNARA